MATLNTTAQVRQEGAWHRGYWADRITSDADFNTFVGGIVQAVNLELQLHVGVDWYNSVLVGGIANAVMYQSLLAQIEMHLAQARLCLAAATVIDAGADQNAVPVAAGPAAPNGADLRASAQEHMVWAMDLVELTRSATAANTGPHIPYVKAQTTSAHVVARFDPVKGDPVS